MALIALASAVDPVVPVEPAPDVVAGITGQLTDSLSAMVKEMFSMVGDLLTTTDIVPCILMAYCASLCVDCFFGWIDAKYPKRGRRR
ncbi:hypothetical protein [Ruminococcus gauvreauii]|uniref:hypothetical protein n=1 Tax=Ruminococcus gauvreauii TaxID=438033 RepID=UPI0039843679